jgi:D-alanine-D-alanine ligase
MRVTVLAGGPSNEREISLQSGAAVADACERLGHDVFKADIRPHDVTALDRPCDIIFPVLHGPYGEDGQLQGVLEQRGIPYVGSNSTASALCMDKDASKTRWREAGLPTAPWVTIEKGTLSRIDEVRLPVVVKPPCEGSSVGITLAHTQEEARRAVRETLHRFNRVFVEQYIPGREVTVGILGDRILPLVEVHPADGFYDFEAKYLRDDTRYSVEPDLDETAARRAWEVARQAYSVLGCRHYGRIDLILDECREPQLLEINTVPGFTEHSLLPKAAARVGIDFDRLIQILLDLASG